MRRPLCCEEGRVSSLLQSQFKITSISPLRGQHHGVAVETVDVVMAPPGLLGVHAQGLTVHHLVQDFWNGSRGTENDSSMTEDMERRTFSSGGSDRRGGGAGRLVQRTALDVFFTSVSLSVKHVWAPNRPNLNPLHGRDHRRSEKTERTENKSRKQLTRNVWREVEVVGIAAIHRSFQEVGHLVHILQVQSETLCLVVD